MIKKQLSKYSKTVARTETLTFRKAKQELESGQLFINNFFDNQTQKPKTTLQSHEKMLFSLGGAYPFIIDFINYIITHHKQYIHNEKSNAYYYIKTTVEIFLKTCMNGEQSPRLRKNILQNTAHIIINPKFKIYSLPNNKKQYGQPILLLRETDDDLLRKTNDKADVLYIYFSKSLFRDLYTGKGSAWFMLPNFIQTQLEMTVDIIENIQPGKYIDNELGDYLSPITMRRFIMFMSLHDNHNPSKQKPGKNEYINIDIKEMLESVYPYGLIAGKTIRSYEKTAFLIGYTIQIYNLIAEKTESEINKKTVSKQWLRIPKTAYLHGNHSKPKAKLVFTSTQELVQAIRKGTQKQLTVNNYWKNKIKKSKILINFF